MIFLFRDCLCKLEIRSNLLCYFLSFVVIFVCCYVQLIKWLVAIRQLSAHVKHFPSSCVIQYDRAMADPLMPVTQIPHRTTSSHVKLIIPVCPSSITQLADYIAAVATHTHTHSFNGHFSGTQVSRYQKGKNQSGFYWSKTVSGSGISWAICKSALAPDR